MKHEHYFLIYFQVPSNDFNGCNGTEIMYLRKYRKNSSALTFCPDFARRFNSITVANSYIVKHQKEFSCKMFIRRVVNEIF